MQWALLFNSVVFGAFVGYLADYWLGRGGVKDNLRLILAVVTAIVVGFLVYNGHVAYF